LTARPVDRLGHSGEITLGDTAAYAARAGERRALDHGEWARLLRMPDRTPRQGKRDLALLPARARWAAARRGDQPAREGCRGASPLERSAAAPGDRAIDEVVDHGPLRQMRPDPRDPLDAEALATIAAWVKVRAARKRSGAAALEAL